MILKKEAASLTVSSSFLANNVRWPLRGPSEMNFEATFHANNSLRICFKYTSSPYMLVAEHVVLASKFASVFGRPQKSSQNSMSIRYTALHFSGRIVVEFCLPGPGLFLE